jgi:hypothetical protein
MNLFFRDNLNRKFQMMNGWNSHIYGAFGFVLTTLSFNVNFQWGVN